MATFTNATREAAALAIAGLGNWISAHTADPGATGANELSGGSPAYARKQTTWSGGASDGVVPGSQVLLDSPAATVTHLGVWTAQTGGTFIGGTALSAPITLGAQGEMKLTPTTGINNT